MDDIATAKSMFPEMPVGVFEMWLQPLILKFGWPFQAISDSIDGSGWENILTWQSLKRIAQLQWHRSEMPFASIRFTPQTQSTISAMFECHILQWPNHPLLRVKDTRERFFRCHEYIKAHKRVPAPCVLMLNEGTYAVFDGNHRIGAMDTIDDERNACTLDAWIGEDAPDDLSTPAGIDAATVKKVAELEAMVRQFRAKFPKR